MVVMTSRDSLSALMLSLTVSFVGNLFIPGSELMSGWLCDVDPLPAKGK